MPRERAAIVSSLTSKGFALRPGNRDHDYYFFSHAGLTRAVFTKVSRGTAFREYNDGLLSKMSRQLQLTRSQLNDLIDCPLDSPGYVTALTARGVIRPLSQGGQ